MYQNSDDLDVAAAAVEVTQRTIEQETITRHVVYVFDFLSSFCDDHISEKIKHTYSQNTWQKRHRGHGAAKILNKKKGHVQIMDLGNEVVRRRRSARARLQFL